MGMGLPMGGPPGCPGPPGAVQFAAQELEYYQQLFSFANPGGRDAIHQLAAADFLMSSHLPQEALHQIWEISADGAADLNAERFCLACRLVAWAQQARFTMIGWPLV
ncbi:unnamed protein product [Effrenium voratum]|nr:unnamed protein product [Effrenium voratum]